MYIAKKKKVGYVVYIEWKKLNCLPNVSYS